MRRVGVLGLVFLAWTGGLWLGSSFSQRDKYDEGWEAGYKSGSKLHDDWRRAMSQVGFCEWPQKFYESINCGSLAPDYPKEKP